MFCWKESRQADLPGQVSLRGDRPKYQISGRSGEDFFA